MNVAVQLGPPTGPAPAVEYRWDEDTDILTAKVRANGASAGMSGSVGVEGSDGSWIVFDVVDGVIRGVEIPVWPEVRKLTVLAPPSEVEEVHATFPLRRSQPGIASLEMTTAVMAEADRAERTIHFRIGPRRDVRAVRVARDILLDVDAAGYLAGVWLLNVPPFPATVT